MSKDQGKDLKKEEGPKLNEVSTRRRDVATRLQRNGYVVLEIQNVVDPRGVLSIADNKLYLLAGMVPVEELAKNVPEEINTEKLLKYRLREEDLKHIKAANKSAIEKVKAERLAAKLINDAKFKKKKKQ